MVQRPVRHRLLLQDGRRVMRFFDLQAGQKGEDLRIQTNELIRLVRLLQLVLVAREYGEPRELLVS